MRPLALHWFLPCFSFQAQLDISKYVLEITQEESRWPSGPPIFHPPHHLVQVDCCFDPVTIPTPFQSLWLIWKFLSLPWKSTWEESKWPWALLCQTKGIVVNHPPLTIKSTGNPPGLKRQSAKVSQRDWQSTKNRQSAKNGNQPKVSNQLRGIKRNYGPPQIIQ